MVGSKTFISGAANVNIDLFFSGLPRLPEEGQELYSKGFSLQMGGGLPATLINLGRLGIPVRIQTGLGKDMFSRFARDAFESAGVTPFNLCPPDGCDSPEYLRRYADAGRPNLLLLF